MEMKDKLLNKIETILPTIHGWCSFKKATKLVELILDKQPEICVEIGVFGGSSLIPQALTLKANNKGMLYGIDPWSTEAALEHMQAEEHIKWWKELDIESIYNHCVSNLTTYELNQFCTLVRDKAENAVTMFEDNSIDLLHIDGNHSEDLAYKDATLYLPKVKQGGIIFFDDIWWTEGNQVTTRKAITYLLGFCERTDLINNECLVFVKS